MVVGASQHSNNQCQCCRRQDGESPEAIVAPSSARYYLTRPSGRTEPRRRRLDGEHAVAMLLPESKGPVTVSLTNSARTKGLRNGRIFRWHAEALGVVLGLYFIDGSSCTGAEGSRPYFNPPAQAEPVGLGSFSDLPGSTRCFYLWATLRG